MKVNIKKKKRVADVMTVDKSKRGSPCPGFGEGGLRWKDKLEEGEEECGKERKRIELGKVAFPPALSVSLLSSRHGRFI